MYILYRFLRIQNSSENFYFMKRILTDWKPFPLDRQKINAPHPPGKSSEWNLVLVLNTNFLIPISMQPESWCLNLWYFKLRIFDPTEFNGRNCDWNLCFIRFLTPKQVMSPSRKYFLLASPVPPVTNSYVRNLLQRKSVDVISI